MVEQVDTPQYQLSPGEVFLSLAGRYRLSPREAEALARACRDAGEADWQEATEETLYRETGGLFCHHLREVGADPPKNLQDEYKWISLSSTVKEAELRRLSPGIIKAGLRVLLIKGTALYQSIYKNPGLRNFEDSDWVLAGHTDWEAAKRELRTLGYRPSGHGDDSRWERGPFIVELHRNVLGDERLAARISGLGASNAEIDGEVWARARPSVLGEPFLMPAPEDHLLIMCAHLMKHSFEPGIWFVDLEALLLETESFDWPAALERAERWGLLRAVAFAFRNLGALGGNKIFGERGDLLPPGVREQLAEVRLTSLDTYLLTLAARGERISGEKKEWRRVPIGNLLWLSSQSTFAGKIRLLWEASFPRGEVMEEIYPDYRPAMRWWFMARRAADLVRLGGRVLALTGRERSR